MKSFLLLAFIALASCLSGEWTKHSLAEYNIYIEGAFTESFKVYANDENVDPDNFVRLSAFSQRVNGTNYRVCFIDRNKSLSIQEFIIYVPLQTSNKIGPIFKVLSKRVIETKFLSLNFKEAYDFLEKYIYKEIYKIGEKIYKIYSAYHCENINNIFYIVITEYENGNHEYVIVRDKATKEFDHFDKIK